MFWFKEKILFSCNQCGNCCKEMDIPLTHKDVIRILETKPDFDLETFVTLHIDKKSNLDSILLYGEYQQMYLSNKLEDNSCLFLKDNICSIYNYRPNPCRTWPLSKNSKNKLHIDNIAQELVNLSCDKNKFKGHKEILKIIEEGSNEYGEYREIVREWNKEVENKIDEQTLDNFINFAS